MGKQRDSRNLQRGWFYHIFNRGNRKNNIALDQEDYQRYIDLMYYFFRKFDQGLVAYCFMPNHYHFLVKVGNPNDFIKVMHGFGSSTATYFNRKYATVGHLCQGRYRHRAIEDKLDLLYVSRYIHRNPIEKPLISTQECKDLLTKYKYSSFNEYLSDSPNGKLLKASYVLEYFRGKSHYSNFVLSENYRTHLGTLKSPAKFLEETRNRIELQISNELSF